MILLRILLLPFSWLYYLVTQIRNRLYDQGLRPSVKFDLPVISVGNLAVGGTGKTPMVEYLIRLLLTRFRVATLSRGYGRTTRGFRIIGDSDTADTAGDEPYQFYTNFAENITVAVGEERALAIPLILQERPEVNVVLLDDAFQHRSVTPNFSILLTDYNKPFFTDFLLPSGRLRESRWNAKRADVIIVTKCPADISADEMLSTEKNIRTYTEKPVFFTSIRYGQPLPFLTSPTAPPRRVVLISGIANAEPLEAYVKQNYTLIRHFIFNDHHKYQVKDVESFIAMAGNDPGLSFLTTEKDKAKLHVPSFHGIIGSHPFYYIPIEVDFIKNGQDFDEMVLDLVKRVQNEKHE
jgi:tetraacyldisaccharide 4'-kinase